MGKRHEIDGQDVLVNTRAGIFPNTTDTAEKCLTAVVAEYDRLLAAARRVVDERFKSGGEWDDLKNAIGDLAGFTGGGE